MPKKYSSRDIARVALCGVLYIDSQVNAGTRRTKRQAQLEIRDGFGQPNIGGVFRDEFAVMHAVPMEEGNSRDPSRYRTIPEILSILERAGDLRFRSRTGDYAVTEQGREWLSENLRRVRNTSLTYQGDPIKYGNRPLTTKHAKLFLEQD